MKEIGWIIFIIVFLVFSKSQILVDLDETVGSCSYSATCSTSGYTGVCISSSCCTSGILTSNLCSGSSDIKCCTQSECTTPSGSGICMQTSLCSSQGGTSVAGTCLGPSDLQCCVKAIPTNGQYGVDFSSAITSTQATCLKNEGITYVIPRGFRSTGTVDTNVCNSITTAATAGITTRDTSIFPCPSCSSSASEQMGELITFLTNHCKSKWSGRIWLDIEGSSYWLNSTASNQAWYKVSKWRHTHLLRTPLNASFDRVWLTPVRLIVLPVESMLLRRSGRLSLAPSRSPMEVIYRCGMLTSTTMSPSLTLVALEVGHLLASNSMQEMSHYAA